MANPNPSPRTRFVKGEPSRNPEGGRRHDPEIKRLRALTKSELAEVGNLIIKKSVADVMAIGQDPQSSALHTMVAAVTARIIKKGDMQAFDVLLNRLIGKVKDEVRVDGDVRAQVVITMPSNGREARKV